MKVTRKGYDPELGQKFMQEHSGSVIGFGRTSKSESDSEPNQYQDLQEQFNEEAQHRQLMKKNAAQAAPETEAESRALGEKRIAGYLRNNPEKLKEVLAKVRKT